MALLQSRVAKRSNKQRRIRAVEDDDRPHNDRGKQQKTKKKKLSNFATDLTDTSKSATKRLRYDANQVQKGKFPKGKGKFQKNEGKGKANGKGGKAFGKPKTAKAGGRKK